MVEMAVLRVGLSTEDGSPVIVLREQDGARLLSIKVSSAHANAVIRHSHRLPPFRPQTHEMFVAAMQALGARIESAELDVAPDGSFLAYLVVSSSNKRFVLPAAAADAIVLAVRAEARLLVSPAVLERLGAKSETGRNEPLQAPQRRSPSPPGDGDPIRRYINTLANLDELGRQV